MGQSRPLHYSLITIFQYHNIKSIIFPAFRNAVTLQAGSEAPRTKITMGLNGGAVEV